MNPTCSENPPTPPLTDVIFVKHEFMTLIIKNLRTCRGDGISGAG